MGLREIFSSLLRDGQSANVLFTLTPPMVRDRPLAIRMLYAGGVVTTLGLSLFSAASAAMLLLLAIGVIYYLLSQVLGLKVDFDPSMLMNTQRQESSSAPN
jgi:hypothetical protein